MSYLSDLGQALLGRASARALFQKASAVGPMIARLYSGRPVWPGIDYEKLAREGYQQNPIVHHAVDEISKAVSTIPIIAYKGKGKKRTEVEEHPILDLLANPNPDQDGVAFIKAWVSNYLLTGNAFIERTDENDLRRMELYVLRTDRTRVIPGPDGFAEAYEYTAGGSKRRIEIDLDAKARPILHDKTYNPLNDWYGMSPLQPCAWAIDITNEAAAWNLGILRNSGAPSGAFVFAPKEGDTDLSPDQVAEMRQQIDEMASHSGRHRPLLLKGGMDWKQMGLNPEQMQYVEGAQHAARQIANTLGIPSQLLNIPGDNTYSNYQEARQAFYQETVIPMAKRLMAKLTHWFARQLGEGIVLEVNTDGLEALAGMRKDMWQGMQAITFLTINEKREALGYERVPNGDDVFIGAGQIPLGAGDITGGSAEADPPPNGKQPPAKGKGLAYLAGTVHQRNDLP